MIIFEMLTKAVDVFFCNKTWIRYTGDIKGNIDKSYNNWHDETIQLR